MTKTFDPKCLELAEHFLQDTPDLIQYKEQLAAWIQESIEDWLGDAGDIDDPAAHRP